MRTLHTKTFLIEAQRRKASYKSKEVGAEYKMDKANLLPLGQLDGIPLYGLFAIRKNRELQLLTLCSPAYRVCIA
ncbi:MAG: hypothetical protein DMG71_12890 [Acidobacteria bacterium]|nr:MAG: hypothetical protein DMG71_12890 [Acidobacteriota bacterium]